MCEMSTQAANAAQILAKLREKLAKSDSTATWLILGDAMADLEDIAPLSQDGRAWSEVIRDFHEDIGYEGLSLGHVQKVRRVRNFVRKVLKAEKIPFTDGEITAAQVSAVEVAERLHTLDQARGQAALLACIRDRRKFVDMRREYDAYIEQRTDRLPKRQTTWLNKRRVSTPTDDAAVVENILVDDPVTFLGAPNVVLRPFQPDDYSQFIKSTDFGFRITGPAGLRTLGVEVISDYAFLKKSPAELLAQFEFQSSFFDLYWVFARADAEKVKWFSSIMDKMRVDRVGLLRLLEDDRWEISRLPSHTPPSPDRRDLLKIR